MNNFIFNLRISGFHFQVFDSLKISPLFAWYDIWIGIYYDTKRKTIYFLPLPMLGIKIKGLRITWNKNYSFKNDPFIWLFQWGKTHYPMRNYNSKFNIKN